MMDEYVRRGAELARELDRLRELAVGNCDFDWACAFRDARKPLIRQKDKDDDRRDFEASMGG